MKSLALLIALMLCASALLTGCDQEMRQPIMQDCHAATRLFRNGFFRKRASSNEKSRMTRRIEASPEKQKK